MNNLPPSHAETAQRSLWALRGFYAALFAVMGVWIPYWPLYLDSHGHSAAVIGLLASLATSVKLFGPPVLGRLADQGSRQRVIQLASATAAVASLLLFFADHFALLLLGVLLFSLMQNTQLSLVEATTLETVNRLQRQELLTTDYGRIRVWGSWGFIVLAIGLGPLIDLLNLELVPWIITLFLMLSALISLRLPADEAPSSEPSQHKEALFSLPGVAWFYLATFLMQFSHGAYYGFLSLHLADNGFSRGAIGVIWSIGVLAEVAMLHASATLLSRFGTARLLQVAISIAVVRWLLYSLPPAWPLLLLGQPLHAFTFGAFHIGAVHRTFEMAPRSSRSRAQGWYGALSFGLGTGSGLLLCGQLYEPLGAPTLFLLMAVGAA
uniref:MFS transporter n=1 Tax=Candidatus Magnetaquicoccus inordinatus TaxID=2496818 RepID=UPI00102C11E9